MKLTLNISFLVLIGLTVFCGVRLHQTAAERTEIKETYGKLNSFTYGLLSADTWKDIMRNIVTDRVQEFQFTPEQQEVLQEETAKVLDHLLADAEKITKKPNNSLGKIKSYFAKSYIKTARQNVDKFAGTINQQLRDPVTMKKLKKMALEQFDAFAATTHSDPKETEMFNRLLAENNVQNVSEFNERASKQVDALDARARYYSGAILVIVFLLMLGWRYVLAHPELQRAYFTFSVVLALAVLFTSLSVPMMEIDARLKSVDLMLIGENIHFNEQVIYYRSKSLMQVVSLLIESGKGDSLMVGFLLIMFSVLFPVTKLVTAVFYLRGNERFNNSKVVQFFAFKSGKWSMADVMVVAIFMSYIGFESILNAQLPHLSVKNDIVQTITTDASSMQIGFILFTTFVLYSMLLSEMLKRITSSPRFQNTRA
jgi:hypothetical protein